MADVLDPKYHAPLLRDLGYFANLANIPEFYLKTSARGFCSDAEIDWLMGVGDHASNGVFGMVMAHKGDHPVGHRMMAMTAACVRNYIDARVIVFQQLVGMLKNGDEPQPTVMFILNFCNPGTGTQLPAWIADAVLGYLYSRQAQGKQTVIAAPSLAQVKAVYGEGVYAFVKNNYRLV